MVMKEFTAGERLFAADLNDNFDETQLAANITSGTFDAARIPAGVGGLVAVKSAIFTGTQTNSTAASANFAVTDLSITHEVADAANKLIISAFIGHAGTSHGVASVSLAVHDGTGLIAIGDAAGSRTRITAGGRPGSSVDGNLTINPAATFVHTPGAGSKTYTLRAVNNGSTTYTIFINRDQSNLDSGASARSVSSLVIQEVRA